MKPARLFLAASCLGFAAAQAKTIGVLPGTSIQAKINVAEPGDIIAIFGGTYNEDITVNKAVRLVEVSGQEVVLNGTVTFSNVTDCPPFEGFTAGSSGRGIAVNNTTGLVIRNLDARQGSGLSTTGSTQVKIFDSQLSNLYPGGAVVEIAKSSIAGGINQTAGTLHTTSITVAGNFDTQTGAQKTVAFRTTVAGDNNWRSKRGWFGYSAARSFNYLDANQAKVVVIGCKIDRQGGEANGIYCNIANSQITILNNSIVNVGYNYSGDGENGIDIRGGGNRVFISNNYCHLHYYGDNYHNPRGDGIYVRDTTQATIINNVIVGAKHGISAPFGATALNNLYWASPWNAREANGVVALGTLYTDPLFVENQAPKLQASSPCIDAGTPDPRYNDRDGSRNDIGPSGGAWYDPEGWTTENPVVISFDLAPDQLLEGVDAEVTISEGQAVSSQ